MEANKTSSQTAPHTQGGEDKDNKDNKDRGGETHRRRGGRNKNRKRGHAGGTRSQGNRTHNPLKKRRSHGRNKSNRSSKFPVPIVFVGMMGCGKTTIASALASKLGQPFKDSDTEIERASNATVTEIFDKYGEDYFRDGERKVIKRLMQQNRRGIIATGGGAYMNDETRAWINENAICVWLRADLETIWHRVSRKSTRPLLKRPDAKEFLAELLEIRDPIYQESHVVVDVNNGTKLDMVRKTLTAIDDYVARQRKLKNPKFMPKKPSYKKSHNKDQSPTLQSPIHKEKDSSHE